MGFRVRIILTWIWAACALTGFSVLSGCASEDPHRASTSGDPDGGDTDPDGNTDPDGSADPDGSTNPDGASSGGDTSGVVTAPDPGRVTIHRLNRSEYNNTVRDLLGTQQRPADNFPHDDYGYGFDNNADVLSLSPLLIELYADAAESLIDEALAQNNAQPIYQRVLGTQATASTGGAWGDGWNLWSNGELVSLIEFSVAGQYKLRARVAATQGGPDLAHMLITLNGLTVGSFDVPATATADAPQTFEVEVAVPAGLQQIGVAFTNDYYDDVTGEDRNLLVSWFEVEGPTDQPVVTGNPQRDALITCDPVAITADACAAQVIRAFGRRAWRRDLTDDEAQRLLAITQAAWGRGDGFDAGLGVALKTALLSPHFVFRVELDPSPESAAQHPLTGYELASRLSYFLWSSMPDDALLDAAASGALQDPAEIERQARRMLADPRAESLVDNFAAQWLYIRALTDASPDVWHFPQWDDDLRAAMTEEMRLAFRALLFEGHPASELLTRRSAFVNQRLAQHYGLTWPGGDPAAFVEVAWPSDALRAGVLTQGGLLTALSYPTRTSPARRGKWVLGQLLCTEPPPPPPGVEGLPMVDTTGLSLRQRLEQHRADPTCAGCHSSMDPIGFSLEGFDGVGVARTEDQGLPLDTSGTLPDGSSFNGPVELAAVISNDPRFPLCISEKMFVYALGRGAQRSDHPYLQQIADALMTSGMRLDDLAVHIATSEPFRTRRGEPPKP
jgi:hypothetical protein